MMRRTLALALVPALHCFACGSSSDSAAGDPVVETPDDEATKTSFAPPVKDGYTRLVAPPMDGLAPGSDISYCQFVMAPLDHDMDVLDMIGWQSKGGHHSLAYATTKIKPVGTSAVCGDEDSMAGAFLGGTGGEGTAITLPENVAFRLPKGNAIMLNTHFINGTDEVLTGETVLDFKFAEVDPNRKIAAFFSNGATTFDIPASGHTKAETACVVREDMNFIFFTSHMHEWGTFGETELVRAGSTEGEIIHTGNWMPEYQAAPVWSTWPVEAPLLVKKGDTLRSRCEWQNTSSTELTFPREMCFGIGFFLSDDMATPVCMNGSYL